MYALIKSEWWSYFPSILAASLEVSSISVVFLSLRTRCTRTGVSSPSRARKPYTQQIKKISIRTKLKASVGECAFVIISFTVMGNLMAFFFSIDLNPLHPKSDLQILLSNARWFYSSKEDPLGLKGLKSIPLNPLHPNSGLQILLCLTPHNITRQRETP